MVCPVNDGIRVISQRRRGAGGGWSCSAPLTRRTQGPRMDALMEDGACLDPTTAAANLLEWGRRWAELDQKGLAAHRLTWCAACFRRMSPISLPSLTHQRRCKLKTLHTPLHTKQSRVTEYIMLNWCLGILSAAQMVSVEVPMGFSRAEPTRHPKFLASSYH